MAMAMVGCLGMERPKTLNCKTLGGVRAKAKTKEKQKQSKSRSKAKQKQEVEQFQTGLCRVCSKPYYRNQ